MPQSDEYGKELSDVGFEVLNGSVSDGVAEKIMSLLCFFKQ